MKSFTALFRTAALSCVTLAGLSGCQFVETEYTWKRTPDQVFTARLKLTEAKRLVILEQYTDKSGQKYPQTIRDYFSNCSFFDDENWECVTSLGNERAQMAKGKFTHYYWTEERTYESKDYFSFRS